MKRGKKKRSLFETVILTSIVLAGLLSLGICCWAAYGNLLPEPTPIPVPSPPPITPASPTPKATTTPVIPSATFAPSPTPDAAATMESQISEYFLKTDEILIGCMVELSSVQELLAAYAANSLIYYSQDWHDAMEWHVLGWYGCTDKLQRYEPVPEPLEEHHAELMLMIAEHDKAQDYLLAWIDTPDVRFLQNALALIESANARFETLNRSRETFGY